MMLTSIKYRYYVMCIDPQRLVSRKHGHFLLRIEPPALSMPCIYTNQGKDWTGLTAHCVLFPDGTCAFSWRSVSKHSIQTESEPELPAKANSHCGVLF